jgi:hypothetical protein
MSHEVNTFDLPEEGFNTDLTTVEVEKLGDVNITQNVDAVPAGGTTGQILAKNSNTDYDTEWITGGGGGGGGSDENYTTAEKNKLASITAIFTTALETAYNSAVTWISANGTNLINHLGLTNNPHSVTKAQVGLGNVPDLDTSTTANITDSTNKRFVTDAQQTIIGNTSGTNTGDNATNSQYSGLSASKQDILVSATNIKTINGNSVLGAGDMVISGGGGSISKAKIIALS